MKSLQELAAAAQVSTDVEMAASSAAVAVESTQTRSSSPRQKRHIPSPVVWRANGCPRASAPSRSQRDAQRTMGHRRRLLGEAA